VRRILMGMEAAVVRFGVASLYVALWTVFPVDFIVGFFCEVVVCFFLLAVTPGRVGI